MNPWEIVGEEDKTLAGTTHKLVLLRSPKPSEPYLVYGLERPRNFWELVDRFLLTETDGSESPEWALERAWTKFKKQGLLPVRSNLAKI